MSSASCQILCTLCTSSLAWQSPLFLVHLVPTTNYLWFLWHNHVAYCPRILTLIRPSAMPLRISCPPLLTIHFPPWPLPDPSPSSSSKAMVRRPYLLFSPSLPRVVHTFPPSHWHPAISILLANSLAFLVGFALSLASVEGPA